MGLTAVNLGVAEVAGLDAPALDRLQWEQFQHDEKYHREIARLTVQDRLKHMALHFAKYAGQVAIAGDDAARIKRLATDVFIIAMSTANILNVRLAERLMFPDADLDAQGFLRALTVGGGRMAAACEKMDHLEDFPFRPEIAAAAIELATNVIAYCATQAWDLGDLVHDRLQPVKEKSIFYGKL